MNLSNAVNVLRRYQDKRLGLDYRSTPVDQQELTAALNVLLKEHGAAQPLIDCSKCRYGNSTFGCCRLEDGIIKAKTQDKLPCKKGAIHEKNNQ